MATWRGVYLQSHLQHSPHRAGDSEEEEACLYDGSNNEGVINPATDTWATTGHTLLEGQGRAGQATYPGLWREEKTILMAKMGDPTVSACI